jgi:NADP-dependent 3-hydroxy acid dehydrogenase YdfG
LTIASKPRILAGRTVAITGAGRGIGRATAFALKRQGMKPAVGDIDVDAARATADELGAGAVGLELDVRERGSFARFLEEAERRLGPLDVLINNAGIMPLGRFVDESDELARRMIDINLHGVILGMKLALERMLPRNSGHIVNISSQAGRWGTPGGATYSATKHAVVGLSEAVRAELRLMRADIDVSYVMPFVVNTELGSGLQRARGMPILQPSEVADAIVQALRHGLVDVWVPRSAKRSYMASTLTPRPIAESFVKLLKAEVLANADVLARRDYELRAAGSSAPLKEGEEPAQLPERAGAPPEPQR